MVVFSPWAFGTTQPWSIQTMNIAGYVLGVLLAAKWRLRGGLPFGQAGPGLAPWIAKILLGISLTVLAYVTVSALNAQYAYVGHEFRADPRWFIRWLPHSLDQRASWTVLANWLALVCTFWAVFDWFVTDANASGRQAARLRRLLLVVVINASLVALEGIIQRAAGTPKLLFFQKTAVNAEAAAQFGPYAYRSNAAQFFNLVWPVALGFWLHLQSRVGSGSKTNRHHWLLPCVILIFAAAIVTTSRGGLATALFQMLLCSALVLASRKFQWRARGVVLLAFAVGVSAAIYYGGNQIAARLRASAADPLSGRDQTYKLAEGMARDYPVFGVGPGAFSSVFQLYRNSPQDYWPGQLHNDWLEYRITLGWVGFGLLLAAGVILLARSFARPAVAHDRTLVAFVWVAISGCLLHARFDFPLQIYSIQLLFLVLCAIVLAFPRSRAPSPR
jgi:hypothetical protein